MVDQHEEVDLDGWRHVFTAAARQNVRKLSYIEGILKNLGKPRPGRGWAEEYAQFVQR